MQHSAHRPLGAYDADRSVGYGPRGRTRSARRHLGQHHASSLHRRGSPGCPGDHCRRGADQQGPIQPAGKLTPTDTGDGPAWRRVPGQGNAVCAHTSRSCRCLSPRAITRAGAPGSLVGGIRIYLDSSRAGPRARARPAGVGLLAPAADRRADPPRSAPASRLSSPYAPVSRSLCPFRPAGRRRPEVVTQARPVPAEVRRWRVTLPVTASRSRACSWRRWRGGPGEPAIGVGVVFVETDPRLGRYHC